MFWQKARLRSGKLTRLGLVLSIPVLLGAAWACYSLVVWPIPPDQKVRCYITKNYLVNGPTRGAQAVGEYEVCSSEIRKANYSNAYYSQVLDIAIINSDQLSAEEFKAAAAYAAGAISRANEKYEMSKAWLWLLIITASIGSTVAMWATLAAADWILAG